jgi:hypothetical protein
MGTGLRRCNSVESTERGGGGSGASLTSLSPNPKTLANRWVYMSE